MAALKKLVLIVLIITFSASLAAAETVRVAFAAEPYPPFTSPDASGNWVGWEIEMIELVCKEANLECVHSPHRLGRHHPRADVPEGRHDHGLPVNHRST